MRKNKCFLLVCQALIINVKCSPPDNIPMGDTEGINSKAEFQGLQDFTKQLEKNLKELDDEHTNLISNIEAKLAHLENKVGALEERYGREGSKVAENGLDGSPEVSEDVHMKISRLHQEHLEQLETIRQKNDHLTNTVASLHSNVHHLATMHNISQRLQRTASLILQERWYEALLHWSFAENHIVPGNYSDANDVLSEYLRQVITFAYVGHGAGSERLSCLYPIFDFVHKLSTNKEYKVYAYKTLVNHMLASKDIFDGTEIFILGAHVRRSYGMNSKAHRAIPAIAQIIGSGSSVHIVYVGDAYNTSHNLQHWKKLNDTDTLDLHTHTTMMIRKSEVSQSLKFPVYGSKHYNPYYSGAWTPIYRNSSYFVIQNAANSGYLNVPSAKDDNFPLLNCVSEADPRKHNIEFSFVYIDEKSFSIRSATINKDLVVTRCPKPEGTGETFCFTVDDPDVHQRSASRFSAITVVAASV
ncbi:unnamed protein product [Allacma fusca]|uniref:Uncharacterized protein n=1 Tax=Allacma fusca TaxID=39272 RepID=A0A8J2Q1W2_9HEXA|nr:unnamed protein product [Allacma fusca]